MIALSRRAVLVGLPLIAASGTVLGATEILRVFGDVTRQNYKGLESFLFNSLDQMIGLKISFEANPDAGEGTVAASQDDGKFVAYLRKKPAESEIVADKGVSFQNGGYVLDGFFVVKSGGMNQGIISLYLDRTDEGAVLVSDARIKEIDINRLKANLRN